MLSVNERFRHPAELYEYKRFHLDLHAADARLSSPDKSSLIKKINEIQETSRMCLASKIESQKLRETDIEQQKVK